VRSFEAEAERRQWIRSRALDDDVGAVEHLIETPVFLELVESDLDDRFRQVVESSVLVVASRAEPHHVGAVVCEQFSGVATGGRAGDLHHSDLGEGAQAGSLPVTMSQLLALKRSSDHESQIHCVRFGPSSRLLDARLERRRR
jgi:hypothetical protein